ncbi:hypothetical protein FB561_2386 [Kribbella amoyensis]|uniref:CDP-glycerol:poly(Glycerophosphate) glycerophosphotransferase n=1 Tax=Kribbella amoyensis TaxID=996641 RepID=A0A561BQY3_9ACTN|nr:hypothetical protein [Kribbella amoyensis]TWD81275.1 hypothetical protein FB561_2386 [Kribbella amoyensis]
MRVFHELTRRSGIHGEPHPVRRTRSDKARLVGKHVAGVATRNPFLATGTYDALVVPHPRKPGGVEIYTDRLRAELGPSALVLDSGINGTPLTGSRNLDFFTSAAGAIRSRSVDAKCATVADALEALTGVKVPIGALVAREIPKHVRLRTIYRALLRRHRIKTVYAVVAYFHQHLVGAARDLGIPVVELQHGAISPYHLGYSYPGRPAVPDQPDELWCFGSYWTTVAELPAGMATRVVGAPYLPPPGAKDPDRVVFLSQGTIGPSLLEFAADFAAARPELDVVFRLHPSEHPTDYTVPAGSKLRISAGPSESTLDLQSTAAYQVGVSTTALFEGMATGCRTAVAELPGHEYLQPVVDRGDALLAADGASLAARLDDAPVCADSTVYYSPDQLTSALKASAR